MIIILQPQLHIQELSAHVPGNFVLRTDNLPECPWLTVSSPQSTNQKAPSGHTAQSQIASSL
jgi:hypothetical protein